MNRKYLFSIILLWPSLLMSEEVQKDYVPRCKDEYSYAYRIYEEAIKDAKEGRCDLSFKKFKESEKQWKYIASLEQCSKPEREDAESNTSRIAYDIEILKRKYCPSVNP